MNSHKQYKHTRHYNERGFTLIELMIVVAIIAILAGIAYPSYTQYVIRGKRSEGRTALLDAAAKLERFYSDRSRYALADDTFPTLTNFDTSTETDKYNLSITTSGTHQSYVLTATPTFEDAECGDFTFTQAGTRGISGSGTISDCWGR